MPRYPYPSDVYVSTEEVGTKYNMNFIVDKLKSGKEMLLSVDHSKLNSERKLEFLAISSILFFTGARISEVLQMKYSDILLDDDDPENVWLTVSLLVEKRKPVKPHPKKNIPIYANKNNPYYFVFEWIRDWYIYITNEFSTAIEMKQIKQDQIYDQPIFKYNRHAYYYMCAKYFKINPHGFRKILAQHMVVEKNMPLKTVQKILGHSSLIALDYYINLRTDDIKKNLLETYKKKGD
jgi:integrase